MGRVLIVDEEPMLRLLLRLVLENDGHEVRDADDGRKALIQIGTWHPHVVVTEMTLPGLDGSHLVNRMRMRAGSVHMRIVATSLSIPPDVDVDATFTKPYDAQRVAKAVDSMLSGEGHDDDDERPRPPPDAGAHARTAVLSDIWSRLVSVDSHAHDCDPECDVALEEIQRLARWIDERVSANHSARFETSRNGSPTGVVGR